MTTTIIRQHTEPLDPQNHRARVHTLMDLPDVRWIYEVADDGHVVERHDVWLDTEIADILETDDGPFDLWDHDWCSLQVGLVVVHVDGTDWYVLPEAWL